MEVDKLVIIKELIGKKQTPTVWPKIKETLELGMKINFYLNTGMWTAAADQYMGIDKEGKVLSMESRVLCITTAAYLSAFVNLGKMYLPEKIYYGLVDSLGEDNPEAHDSLSESLVKQTSAEERAEMSKDSQMMQKNSKLKGMKKV